MLCLGCGSRYPDAPSDLVTAVPGTPLFVDNFIVDTEPPKLGYWGVVNGSVVVVGEWDSFCQVGRWAGLCPGLRDKRR